MNKIWNLPKVEFIPFAELEDNRPALIVTSALAWKAVKDELYLNIAAQIEVQEATTEYWDNLHSKIQNRKFEVVYSVGGGITADAAKYFSPAKY